MKYVFAAIAGSLLGIGLGIMGLDPFGAAVCGGSLTATIAAIDTSINN